MTEDEEEPPVTEDEDEPTVTDDEETPSNEEEQCLLEDAVIASYFYKPGNQYYGLWISCDAINFEYID